MIKPFGVDDVIYDPDWYDRINTFDFDLPFYRMHALASEGPVLELCCGTGRLTVPLAEAGVDITGVDLSGPMLDRAKQKARDAGVEIPFVLDDIRSFRLDRMFDMVFIPFNSLQGIFDWQDVLVVFEQVKAHLKPGGLFIFDIFNPDFEYMRARKEHPVDLFRFDLDDGRPVVIRETCDYDVAAQVNRVTWYFDVAGETFTGGLDVRCFFPQEILALVHGAGFEVVEWYGSFDESAFTSDSRKQILVCRHAAAWEGAR